MFPVHILALAACVPQAKRRGVIFPADEDRNLDIDENHIANADL